MEVQFIMHGLFRTQMRLRRNKLKLTTTLRDALSA